MSTEETHQQELDDPLSSSDSDRDSPSDFKSDSESDSESNSAKPRKKKKKVIKSSAEEEISPDDRSQEAIIKRLDRALILSWNKRLREEKEKEDDDEEEEEEEEEKDEDKLFNFPVDEEDWKEEDLKELWADAPLWITKPGWDPAWIDYSDWKEIVDDIVNGHCEDPPIAPFYLPYRKYYPAIPDDNIDIEDPKTVIEELDRIEEFLKWVSYVFADGSTYEGTVWDDLAHGKGVYVAEQGLVRYEGEWLQNNMEGHGVVEVDVPDMEPLPGSKLEKEMRAEGKVFKRDFMDPEDKKWLEMDIEDSVQLAGGTFEIPWYENKEWVRQYGEKPEKGRYRYAGQWKHSRMHGCGVYEVNERTIYGRFYFGELVEDPDGCDADICAMHAGIAEVAAAKARMFVNKPDGMVREQRGPYGDPQHPYFYEEEDAWQAPGFINQFYEVPDYWKTYAQEVDQEREMWLNSFYKAPLRLPMPAELEYWWQNDQTPEFVLLKKEPEPDPKDPSKLIQPEDPIILHTPTGRLINYVEDEEHGVRLFWHSPLKEGEDVDLDKVEFLPLGFDEFYGRETGQKETFLGWVMSSMANNMKASGDKQNDDEQNDDEQNDDEQNDDEQNDDEQMEAREMRKKVREQERELVEAELCLEEAIEDMEEELERQEKEAEMDAELGLEEGVGDSSMEGVKEEKVLPQEGEYDGDDDDEEEDDDVAPSSFGSVGDDNDKGNGSSKSPFSTLSFASSGLLLAIPSIEQSFSGWKKGKSPVNLKVPTPLAHIIQDHFEPVNLITFPKASPKNMSMKVKTRGNMNTWVKQLSKQSIRRSQIWPLTSQPMPLKNCRKWDESNRLEWLHSAPDTDLKCILSLQVPVQCADDIYWIV